LSRGSKLDGEVELAAQLGISRPTMRAAMKQLVDKGLLIRRRGIGTIVAPRPVRRAVALTSLYDDLTKAGREPHTRVLSLERIPASPEIAEALGLEAGEEVIRIKRLRCAGSDPIALMHNALPARPVGARKAEGEETEMLEVEPGDPLLTMKRTAYDAEGRAVEHGWHSYPAEAYSFEMMLSDL
jgi:DNA-binding GntR family transcriptional regulator